jgi:hypothetical protein
VVKMSMNSMSYPLLENAPDHDSPEFLDYLREHNTVVKEYKNWLVIENCKYHRPDRPWHTAFWKNGSMNTRPLQRLYWQWEWLKKAKDKQTVERFHIHFYLP